MPCTCMHGKGWETEAAGGKPVGGRKAPGRPQREGGTAYIIHNTRTNWDAKYSEKERGSLTIA